MYGVISPKVSTQGHRAPVEPEPVEHRQQRRNQDRNESDVHRNQILRRNRREREDAEQRVFETEQLLRGHFTADPLKELPRDEFRDAGARNRDREGSEHDIVDREHRAVVEAALERFHRRAEHRNGALPELREFCRCRAGAKPPRPSSSSQHARRPPQPKSVRIRHSCAARRARAAPRPKPAPGSTKAPRPSVNLSCVQML